MDQFSLPSENFAEPAPQNFAPPHQHAGNGAHPPFNGFDDPMPPMGEHGMPPPPDDGAPFEPNPLLAALAQEPLPPELHPVPAPPPLQSPLFAPRAPASQHRPNGASNGAGNGVKPAARRTVPDFSGLPPAMAESLAKLAGVPWPPRPEEDERELEEQASGPLPGTPRREG
jgi:hypothetical protein